MLVSFYPLYRRKTNVLRTYEGYFSKLVSFRQTGTFRWRLVRRTSNFQQRYSDVGRWSGNFRPKWLGTEQITVDSIAHRWCTVARIKGRCRSGSLVVWKVNLHDRWNRCRRLANVTGVRRNDENAFIEKIITGGDQADYGSWWFYVCIMICLTSGTMEE